MLLLTVCTCVVLCNFLRSVSVLDMHVLSASHFTIQTFMNTALTNNIPYKTAWITGASRGIGLASAKMLARRGVNLALSGRDAGALTAATQEIRASLAMDSSRQASAQELQILPVVCDVAQASSIEAAYGLIVSTLGEPSLLLNNAGIGIFAPLLETSLHDLDAMLSVNLRGAILTAQIVAQSMMHRQHGAIVTINSVASIKSFPNCCVYAASKAGLLAASRVMREELRGYGVKVIDLLLGATETAIWNDAAREEFRTRMMQPDDVAAALIAVLEMPSRLMPEEVVLRPQGGDL
jgi:3-oxoacyl-[acyl-carrier protein] reductase